MTKRTMRIGFVGAGYRLAPYLTVIRALPDEFEAAGAVVRTENSAERLSEDSVPATTSLDRFLGSGPYDFVLLSVPWSEILPMAGRLLDAGQVVLSETPIAERTDLVGPFLQRFGPAVRLQSAEQYRFQPMHAARIAVARSGRIGGPVAVDASFAHDYHAMSVIRAALGIGFEPVTITASRLDDRGVRPLGRAGWAERLEVESTPRTIASLRWQDSGRSAVHDFTGEQYFSPIRSRRMAVRGTLGELAEDRVRAIREPGAPWELDLVRTATGIDGDLGGHHLRDIRLGETVLWRNPFGSARLSDDELAVAAVLRAMSGFVADGTPFYGIADAAEDQYLGELVHRSASEGRAVTSAPQAWSELPSVLG